MRARVVPARAWSLPLLVLAVLSAGCGESRDSGAGPDSGSIDADAGGASDAPAGWTPEQLDLLRSLWIGSLPARPPPSGSGVADDVRAARLGHRLFFERRLSSSGEVACVTCHRPEHGFADTGARSRGVGETSRNAPTVIGAAYSPWQYWDGRRDSLWSQALAPLESADEMASTRLEVARWVTSDPAYAGSYREIFGDPPRLPALSVARRASPFGDDEGRASWQSLSEEERHAVDTVFANVGKAIEAYERLLVPGPSRFDVLVELLLSGQRSEEGVAPPLDEQELAGLRLFLDPARTQCLRCHNGPLLTNHSFHNVATGRGMPPDLGRFLGVQAVLLDAFNCLGPHSDAGPDGCGELRHIRKPGRELAGAFKTPTLRSVGRTAPYFHDGSRPTLEAVMAHYIAPPEVPGHELPPLELDSDEVMQLVAFLRALDGGVAAAPVWLAAPP